MIRAIAALDDKRGIATNGGIPWQIPEDRIYFRTQTENDVVLMGWATYLEFEKPLPNRRNIVVSRTAQPVREGFELVTNVDEFLQQATQDIWIIGGAGLYETTLEYCRELYLTQVQGDFSCDRFFPEYQEHYDLQTESTVGHEGEYEYRFAVYARTEKPVSP